MGTRDIVKQVVHEAQAYPPALLLEVDGVRSVKAFVPISDVLVWLCKAV
jgi:hypothetical protein